MVATAKRSAALSDWREQTAILISVACASVLVIAGLLIIVVRKLSEQHRVSRLRLGDPARRLPVERRAGVGPQDGLEGPRHKNEGNQQRDGE